MMFSNNGHKDNDTDDLTKKHEIFSIIRSKVNSNLINNLIHEVDETSVKCDTKGRLRRDCKGVLVTL